MEQNKVLTCALISMAVLAIIFQAVGLFTPAWLRISAKVDLDTLGSDSLGISGTQNGGSAPGPSDLGMGDVGQSFPSDGDSGQTDNWPNDGKSMNSGFDSSISGSSGPSEGSVAEDMSDSNNPFGGMSALGGKMETETDFGLWTATECVKTKLISKCVDMNELRDKMGSDSDQSNLGNLSLDAVLSGLHKCAVLASLGFVASIAGCVVMFILLRQDNTTKGIGIVCASLWGLSVIFTLAAVAMQANQNSTYDHSFKVLKALPMVKGIDLEMPIAWSLLMSGFGCLFAAVAGVMIAVAVCYLPTQVETWNRFHNQAV